MLCRQTGAPLIDKKVPEEARWVDFKTCNTEQVDTMCYKDVTAFLDASAEHYSPWIWDFGSVRHT